MWYYIYNQSAWTVSYWMYQENNDTNWNSQVDKGTHGTGGNPGEHSGWAFLNPHSSNGCGVLKEVYRDTTWNTQFFYNAECQVWHHVVGTFNGTASSLYFNGVLVDGSDIITDAVEWGNMSIGVGVNENGNSGFFNGKIDEVMIYNRSLSASEVQQIFLAQSNEREFQVTRIFTGIRTIDDNFVLSTTVNRLYSALRKLAELFNLDNLVERTATLFKTLENTITIETITDKLRSIETRITQFITFLINLFSTPTYSPFNYIDSNETLTQFDGQEQIRVEWQRLDNWTVRSDSPQDWTNVTKTYTLPTDCDDVTFYRDGINISGTDLVSNTLCVYTYRNNNTLEITNSTLINITYDTSATSSAEGTWLASNKRVGSQTGWRNQLTLSNPSTQLDYTNISVNMTSDIFAINTSILVRNSSNDALDHNFTQANGNINWTDELILRNSNDVFTTDYNTPEINLSEENFILTVGGQVFDIHNITISVNSSRSIPTVFANFTFNDTTSFENKLLKCSNGTNNCTEDITNRIDVSFSDTDADGSDDLVEWFVTTLDQNQSYQLTSNTGFPIETSTIVEIINKPVRPFDTINWKATITMFNANSFEATVVNKYEFPLGVRDVALDSVGKNLQFDPSGNLAPFVTIIDKTDTTFLNSVRLFAGETKTFELTYRTDSVTVFAETIFPDFYKVDEKSMIVQVLRVKNQAEDNVTDIEYLIPIDYAEDLVACSGEHKSGCPEKGDADFDELLIGEDSLVKGDFKLQIDELESGDVKIVTVSYFVPTATLEEVQNGRRSINGVLTNFRKYQFLSIAPFTMDDLKHRDSEIKASMVVDILECRANGVCDIPLSHTTPFRINLGAVGIGERKQVYVWYLPDDVSTDEERVMGFFSRIWFLEPKFEIDPESTLFNFVGFLAVDENGKFFIYTGQIIIIGVGIVLLILLIIWLLIRRNRKKREGNQTQDPR